MTAQILLAVFCWGQLSLAPETGDAVAENVEVRYARAQLDLAEANLQRIEQSNKRVARSVPSSVVAEYQRDVQVAKKRLELAAAGHDASEFTVWLQRAESEHKTAESAWRKALAVNRRVPGTFDPLDIERLRLRAEVATLQLERGRKLANASLEAQLRWEVDLLDNQVQRLKDESRRTTSTIYAYPFWRW